MLLPNSDESEFSSSAIPSVFKRTNINSIKRPTKPRLSSNEIEPSTRVSPSKTTDNANGNKFHNCVFDATLKYNINPVEFALDKIKQLKGVTFNYFKDNKESAGLLAQDVEKVMPSAVSERKLPLHTGDEKAYKTFSKLGGTADEMIEAFEKPTYLINH